MPDPAGWIPAYRRLFESDHWLAPTKRDPASRRDAWLDLCQMATWQPRETIQSGTLQRGELVVSLRTLGKRWKWDHLRVRRFLRVLHECRSIDTIRETPDGTVYRVVNYDTYAVGENGERNTKRNSGETAVKQEQEVKHSRRTATPSLRSGAANGNGIVPWTSTDVGSWDGGKVLDVYVQFCRKKGWPDPPVGQRGKLGAAGKRLALKSSPAEIVAAMVGMEQLYPHSDGEPWDLMDLAKKFTKAVAASANNPEIQRRKFERAFLGDS